MYTDSDGNQEWLRLTSDVECTVDDEIPAVSSFAHFLAVFVFFLPRTS
jgi:hypothetical protein